MISITMIGKADKEPATDAATDKGESIALMEPMMVGEIGIKRFALADLAIELTAKSTGFRNRLPDGIVRALADLVRSMNCYYSNLIEGHDTHPIDIERALKNDYSEEPKKRDLQKEAIAHIEVQKWIDLGGLDGARRRRTDCGKFTAVFANCCPKICSGWKIPRPKSESRFFLASTVSGTSRSDSIFRLVRARCRASWSVSRKHMPGRARWIRF